jgi:hypothetical protein
MTRYDPTVFASYREYILWGWVREWLLMRNGTCYGL